MPFSRVTITAGTLVMMIIGPMIGWAAGGRGPPPASELCVPQGEPGERAVDPLRLVRWAIETSGLRDRALDTNSDGDTLLAEKQLALSDPGYCGHPERRCDAADAAAQREIHRRLASFVSNTDGGYRFERIRRPDPAERDGAAYLDEQLERPGRTFQIGETLAVPAHYVRIVCIDRPPMPVAVQQEAPADRPPSLPIRAGFRLTGRLADLGKDRSKLRAIAPAQLSISGDLKQNQTTYLVNLFAGYEVELGQQDRSSFSAIPFVQFERRFNRARTDIDKLGAGGKFLATTVSEDLGSNELALSPFYLTDTRADRQILTVQLRASPSLPERFGVPIGYSAAHGPLLWQIGVDGLIETGHVFRARNTDSPLTVGNFVRAGSQLSLLLQGTEGTLLERLELDLAYKYLYGLAGSLAEFHRFDASLSYLLPGSDRYKVGLSYSIGRVDDTLQDQEYWSTVLGVRF